MSTRHSDPNSVTIAIETSQRTGSVALRDADGSVLEQTFLCGSRERDELLPSIDRLLERAGGTPDDIGLVVVSVGPGSFTGLRIATSTAKALAMGVGCGLIALPSAWGMAEHWYRQSSDPGPVLVASAAKGTDCWLTRLERQGKEWVESGSTGLHEVVAPDAQVRELCADAILLADDFIQEKFIESCKDRLRGTAPPIPSAAACLIAAARFERLGQLVSPEQISPLYPREPEAVSLWRARKA
ncbi:MAG: tRNA (adenosine(37)-N6)-threonylcarbamoyltransferase complex dimerization subunit type 1 TsaB [Planctomycetes bacterium TMED75]|nr:tRNA (adenosine(37)-N6)-threonylcarbamoyltransferase complex dimerization subunit type 1 TsaB [Planctomycetaceae bacterium]OUU90999.1 MAG: tRNA (adenosine(37)-N6)-threonylcarbamoyltransferase complex dimerization subunit type 1 TsaB [Planctomycetes bacterium TMED75]